MDNLYLGDSRILYVKVNGTWCPIACLTGNPFSESSEMLPTTTRDNAGWATSRPIMQSYDIAFDGLQLNTTQAGGNSAKASYDRLRLLKRDGVLISWKIQGTFPVVDFGQGYITSISESNATGEFLSFSGTITGYGKPQIDTLNNVLVNNGNPTVILTDGNGNLIQT